MCIVQFIRGCVRFIFLPLYKPLGFLFLFFLKESSWSWPRKSVRVVPFCRLALVSFYSHVASDLSPLRLPLLGSRSGRKRVWPCTLMAQPRDRDLLKGSLGSLGYLVKISFSWGFLFVFLSFQETYIFLALYWKLWGWEDGVFILWNEPYLSSFSLLEQEVCDT